MAARLPISKAVMRSRSSGRGYFDMRIRRVPRAFRAIE
ncbi:hypothetical protein BURCENBC7_AP5144 [Burkholderia cenocepacia BC7]|nr:hypothetical protein BURCENK562V_C4205 [Burkholderia cenocepacia K56-2Valvano]ERI26379.1 hypothetical protein BURCENBC7_AP5144 [Burkholderia cenocepacia BC7]